jgi:hypothetical protein
MSQRTREDLTPAGKFAALREYPDYLEWGSEADIPARVFDDFLKRHRHKYRWEFFCFRPGRLFFVIQVDFSPLEIILGAFGVVIGLKRSVNIDPTWFVPLKN